MGKKRLRVMQVLVGKQGKGDLESQETRFALFEKLLAKATEGKRPCHILLLPAGFWTIKSRWALSPLMKEIADIVKGKDIVVVGGADAVGSDKTTATDDGWPFWGFAIGSNGVLGHWRQHSTNDDNATEENAVEIPSRIVTIGGHNVLIMLCGEVHGVFNRAGVARALGDGHGIDLVLNPAHSGTAGRAIRGMRAMARTAGAPGVRAEHRASKSGSFQRAKANGEAIQKKMADHDVVHDISEKTWVRACRFSV